MKKFFRILIPIILVIAIIACIGWYLMIYDRDFTRDMLLSGARYFENQGNHTVSSWFYDQAYIQASNNDAVAIELAMQGAFGAVDLGGLMAMLILAIAPILAFYLFAQRYVIEGITAGAVKG